MASLLRKKPFLIPATILSFVLLALACITQRHTSYTSTGIFGSFIPISGDNADFCNGVNPAQTPLVALKVIQSPSQNAPQNTEKTYVRCPWEGSTGQIFLAAACLMCAWSLLELFLAYKNKFYLIFNIMDIFVLALGSVAAGFMLGDIQQNNGNCSTVDQINQYFVNNSIASYLHCVRNIYTISFILLIVALVLWLFQLIYNIIRRKIQNEPSHKDAGYSSVPAQQSVPTDPHAVPVGTAGDVGTTNRLP